MVIGAATMGRVPRVMGGASGKGAPAGATSGAGMGANTSTPVVVDMNSSAAANTTVSSHQLQAQRFLTPLT